MYSLLIGTLIFASTPVWSEVGRVIKTTSTDAFISRGGSKLPVKKNSSFKMNDHIITAKSPLMIQFNPSTEVTLAPLSEIKFSEKSVIDFNKGLIKVKSKRALKIQAEDVAFDIEKAAEFEVSLDSDANVDLDVIQGEVIVSSPFVHTFVPEIVKANEGFRFDKKKRSFSRRAVKQKLKPGSGN